MSGNHLDVHGAERDCTRGSVEQNDPVPDGTDERGKGQARRAGQAVGTIQGRAPGLDAGAGTDEYHALERNEYATGCHYPGLDPGPAGQIAERNLAYQSGSHLEVVSGGTTEPGNTGSGDDCAATTAFDIAG